MSNLQKDLSKYIAQSLNKTIKKMKNEQSKLIAQEYKLPLNKIKKMTRTFKANPNNLKVSLRTLNIHISLNNFKTTQVKQGKKVVGVRANIGKQNILLKGHFIGKSKDRGGKFIAIRDNSKHLKNPALDYTLSSKAYPDFSGTPRKLMYPAIKERFDIVASKQSTKLNKQAQQIFMDNLK